MKQVLYTLCYLLFSTPILAQSINPSFEVKNFELNKDVYALDHGTRGLLLVFDYKYSNNQKPLTSIIPKVTLHKNGMEIYSNQSTILLLKSNEWSTAQVFVPYRGINLLNGDQEGVKLSLLMSNLIRYTTEFTYRQPLRYLVDINLQAGSAKKELIHYDQSPNPKEWLPDLYYVFTTNEGQEPVYQSKVRSNTYNLTPKKFQFYILEGEQLDWSFYDRDGGDDLKLGTFNKLNPQGEYRDEVYGQMFGKMRNVEFTFTQRAQSKQAISIYSDPNYVHLGKKGVAVTIEYDLGKAHIGRAAKINLNCFNQNGIMLNMPVFYPIEGTPQVTETIDLEVKGTLKYFIPFYIWKNDCRDIEFYFELEDKKQINAARHSLLEPIIFDDWVIDAEMAVLENTEVEGAKGVRIDLDYALTEVYKNSPLRVKFLDEMGKKLPFSVYYIATDGSLREIKERHLTENPRKADHLSYFIPYASVNKAKITVEMDLVPDIAMNILKKRTPLLVRKYTEKDIKLELVAADARFRSDNYGQVLEMKLQLPQFFLGKTKFDIQVHKNRKNSEAFVMDGMFTNNSEDYILKEDSGRIYVVFPHRNIKAGTQFSLKAFVTNLDGDALMSEEIEWEWKAPKELFNRKIEVALNTCKFDKKILQDTTIDRNFPWYYVVEAGGEILVKEPLAKRLSAKQMKEGFKQEVLVNREDNITIKLVHHKRKRPLVIWNGDLSKWEQSDFRSESTNTYPVRMARVSAKVDKDYKKNTITGAL